MRICSLFVLAATLLPLAPAVGDGGDTSFAYHGCLLDDKGQVLAARNHTIEFRIYDQATGGLPLWTCTRDVLLDAKGQFSVELSGNTVAEGSLSSLLAENAKRPLYIGLSVDGDRVRGAEISPRQKLLAVPKALRTADAAVALRTFNVDGATCSGNEAVFTEASVSSLEMPQGLACRASLAVESMSVTGNVNVVNGSITGNGAIPIGGIVCWNNYWIPQGWAICNGQVSNGIRTPDLRDRFVVSIGSQYGIGARGGEATHRLQYSEMPSHSHNYTVNGAGSYDFLTSILRINYSSRFFAYDSGGDSATRTTDSTGRNLAHENRPPYYALLYIMRVK